MPRETSTYNESALYNLMRVQEASKTLTRLVRAGVPRSDPRVRKQENLIGYYLDDLQAYRRYFRTGKIARRKYKP